MRSAHRSSPHRLRSCASEVRSDMSTVQHRTESRTAGFQSKPRLSASLVLRRCDGRWRRLTAPTLGRKSSSRQRVGQWRPLNSSPTLRAPSVTRRCWFHPCPASASMTSTAPATCQRPARNPRHNWIRGPRGANYAGGPAEDLGSPSVGRRYAGVSRDIIYTVRRCELRHARIGGRRSIRLKPEWIDAWLEQHARGTIAARGNARGGSDHGTDRARV
jgi:hypothetical protein